MLKLHKTKKQTKDKTMSNKANKDKNGGSFTNFGSGKDRITVYTPKNNGKPAVFDNKKKLNPKGK